MHIQWMFAVERPRQVHFEVPQPLLLCTYTNVAVDNLVDGLVKAGVKPLRVGYHGTIRSSLIPYSLDYKLQQHPLTATVQKLVDESATTQEGIEELNGKYKDLEKKVEDAGSAHATQGDCAAAHQYARCACEAEDEGEVP